MNPQARYFSNELDDKSLVRVATHEIGHALGFAHDHREFQSTQSGLEWRFDSKTGKLNKIKYRSEGDSMYLTMSGRGESDSADIIPIGQAEKNALQKWYH